MTFKKIVGILQPEGQKTIKNTGEYKGRCRPGQWSRHPIQGWRIPAPQTISLGRRQWSNQAECRVELEKKAAGKPCTTSFPSKNWQFKWKFGSNKPLTHLMFFVFSDSWRRAPALSCAKNKRLQHRNWRKERMVVDHPVQGQIDYWVRLKPSALW